MTLNSFLRGTAIATVFAVLVAPFLVSNALFFPFIAGKGFYFRTIVEIGFAAWILLSLRDAASRPRKSLLLWSFFAFMAVIGLADIFGMNPWKSFWSNFERMEGYIGLLHLFMYFIVATAVLSTENLWRWFINSWLGASLIMCIYAFFQIGGLVTINQGGVRVDGTLGNATYLAIFMVFSIFFSLWYGFKYYKERISATFAIVLYSLAGVFALVSLVVSVVAATGGALHLGATMSLVFLGLGLFAFIVWLSRKYSVASLYVLIGLSSLYVLYFTATRGAILGLLGGLFLSAILIAIFDSGLRRKIALYGVAAVVLVVVAFLGARHSDFVQKSPVLSRFASISWNDTKTQARGYIWPMAFEGFKEHPILGWGQENFNYVFNKNYNPEMYRQEQWFDHTHNIVLDWLNAGGILGLLAYLSLFVSAVYLLWRKSIDLTFTEKAILTGLGAAYFFHNLFVFDNLISYILFVTTLGFIHFKSTRLTVPVADDREDLDSSETYIAAPLILVALVFALYFFNWRGFETNRSLINALRAVSVTPVQAAAALTSFEKALSYNTLGRPEVVERLVEAVKPMNGSAVPLDIRQKFKEMAQKAVEHQTEWFKGDARYEVFAGNFYALYGDSADAERHLAEALKLSPNKQTILYQIGNLYISAKKYDEAVAVFKKAYELEPSNPDAAKYYSAALIYAGREDEARSLLSKTVGENDSAFLDTFISAYADLGRWDKVIEIIKARIALDPKNLQLRMNLVASYFQSGNKTAAISTLREMIALDPSFKEQGEQYIKEIQSQP